MRIVLVSQGFPPEHIGGTELATERLARCLARSGHVVHVVTSLSAGVPRRMRVDDFSVHRVRYPRLRYLGIAWFWVGASICILRIKPDAVHVQALSSGMCAVIVQALARVPYLVYCRGSDVYGEWLFKKQVGRLVMSQAGAVVALTEHMRRQMRSLCDKDVVVIPNGVDFARFRGLPYKREARRRLNLFPECPTLLYVGKLVRVKGVRFLVEAMDAVRHEVPSCQLVIVGAGTELQALERLVERLHLRENVRFVGEVSNDEVPLLMAAADVFVLPSLSEGFPNVLLEAMAAGLPVVATNVGGIPELVEEGENGFLVQPEDAAGLERRLRDMLADSTLARSIGEANSRKSLGYKWEDVAAQLEGLYRQVVDASRDVADRAPDSLGR